MPRTLPSQQQCNDPRSVVHLPHTRSATTPGGSYTTARELCTRLRTLVHPVAMSRAPTRGRRTSASMRCTPKPSAMFTDAMGGVASMRAGRTPTLERSSLDSRTSCTTARSVLPAIEMFQPAVQRDSNIVEKESPLVRRARSGDENESPPGQRARREAQPELHGSDRECPAVELGIPSPRIDLPPPRRARRELWHEDPLSHCGDCALCSDAPAHRHLWAQPAATLR